MEFNKRPLDLTASEEEKWKVGKRCFWNSDMEPQSLWYQNLLGKS